MNKQDRMGDSEHELKAQELPHQVHELREVLSNESAEQQPPEPEFHNSLPNNLQVIRNRNKRRRRIFSIDGVDRLPVASLNPEKEDNRQPKVIAVNQIRPIILNVQNIQYNNPLTSECSFCAQSLTKQKFQKIFKCSHTYCKDCLKLYIENQVKNFKLITCPDETCRVQIDQQNSYLKEMGKQIAQKYDIIKFRASIEKNQKLVLCPSQTCKKGYIQKKQGSKTGQCKQCKITFCLNCKMKSHPGKCDNFEEILLKDKFKYKRCYGCQRVVERNQGCPHMTCKCGTQFCYYCAGRWEVPHRCLRYLAGGQLVTDKLNNGLKCLRPEEFEYEYTVLGFIVKLPYYLVCLLILAVYISWCLAVFAVMLGAILVCSFFAGYIALMYKLCRDGNTCGKVAFILLLILLPLGFVIGWIGVFAYCFANAIPKFLQLALSARLFPCYLC